LYTLLNTVHTIKQSHILQLSYSPHFVNTSKHIYLKLLSTNHLLPFLAPAMALHFLHLWLHKMVSFVPPLSLHFLGQRHN